MKNPRNRRQRDSSRNNRPIQLSEIGDNDGQSKDTARCGGQINRDFKDDSFGINRVDGVDKRIFKSTAIGTIMEGGKVVNYNPKVFMGTQSAAGNNPPASRESQEKRFKEQLTSLNKDAYDESNRNIPAGQIEIFPEIVESADFYSNGHSAPNPIADITATQMNLRPNNGRSSIKSLKYMKDRNFNFPQQNDAYSISIESLKQMIYEKVRQNRKVIGIFAQAGAGKTTLMRHLVRKIMDECGLTEGNNYIAPRRSRFQLVRLMNARDIRLNDKSNIENLIFDGFVPSTDMEYAAKWLRRNDSKVAIFIDGLDEASWTLDDADNRNLRPLDKDSMKTVLFNLFSQKCLGGSSVMLASREFTASTLPVNARPEKILTLSGFRDEDAEKLFNKLVQSDSSLNPWQEMQMQFSTLSQFLTIPVYFEFATIIYQSRRRSIPKNTTCLLGRIQSLLPDSKHINECKDIFELLKKLKPLSFEGLKNSRVMFGVEDLKRYSLTERNASDLLVGIPTTEQDDVTGKLMLYFCHKSLQEFFSALYIAEMGLCEFRRFSRGYLVKENWAVVCQFVIGVLYTLHDNRKFFEISWRQLKKFILRRHLASAMTYMRGHQMLEMYMVLNESKKGTLIRSLVKQIEFTNIYIGQLGAYAISCIISKCYKLKFIRLVDCGINDEFLAIMTKNLQAKKKKRCIKDVVIHGCSASKCTGDIFKAFLSNLTIDKLVIVDSDIGGMAVLEWKNVSQVTVFDHDDNLHSHILMTKKKKSIEMKLRDDEGKLVNIGGLQGDVFHRKCPPDPLCLHYLYFGVKYMGAASLMAQEGNDYSQQYLSGTELKLLTQCDIGGKVSEIVLGLCGGEIDASVVSSFVQHLQIEVVDVVVEFHEDISSLVALQDELATKNCELNIHVFEAAANEASLTRILASICDSGVENLRLHVSYAASKDELGRFIRNASSANPNLVRVTLLIEDKVCSLANDDEMNLLEMAKELTLTQLEVRRKSDPRDAWWYKDFSYNIIAE